MRNCIRPVNRSKRLLAFTSLVLVLMISIPGNVGAQDDWFGADKFLHLIGSFLATSVSYTVAASAWDLDHDKARMIGAVTGVVVSIGKEVYDSMSGRGYASGKDLFWDGIGIGMGMVMINQMKENPSTDNGTGMLLAGMSLRPMYIKPGWNASGAVNNYFPLPGLKSGMNGIDSSVGRPTFRTLLRK